MRFRFILSLVAVIALSACSNIEYEAFAKAQTLCENHRGVQSVSSTALKYRFETYCNNGIRIAYSIKE